jgi:HTH-type transcriptional repressor of NAD biosynthesis genes
VSDILSEADQKQFARGLVVGKFSPLHRGHELVIQRAFEMCHEVVLISYSKPEFPGCEAARREKWLADAFPEAIRLVATVQGIHEWFPAGDVNMPSNDDAELVHRRFTGSLCLKKLGFTVDAIFTSEDYGDGFALELTHYFREHMPSVPVVRHILVDRERKQAPISGARIRADLESNRHWLSPLVYQSFVRRVCILGGESSGKSTLAEALAMRFGTVHVPEYGRELWEEKNGALMYEDMLRIGQTQVAAEDQTCRQAKRFLFCDTSPLTTLFYSQHLFQRADPRLEELAAQQYDLVVLCGNDFPFVQDGTRQDEKFREHQHRWYADELNRRGVPFLEVTGNVSARIAQISERLGCPLPLTPRL